MSRAGRRRGTAAQGRSGGGVRARGGYPSSVLWLLALLLLADPVVADVGRGSADIEGQLFDPAAQRPVDDVRVALFQPIKLEGRSFPEPWVPEAIGDDGVILARARSDAEGRFRFVGVAPGRYELRVFDGPGGHAFPVEVGDAPVPVQLELSAGADLSGVVVDEQGVPRPEVFVFVAGLAGADGGNELAGGTLGRPVRTDEQGRWRLRWLPQGELHLQAAHRSVGYSERLPLPLDPTTRLTDIRIVLREDPGSQGDRRDAGRIGIRVDFTRWGPQLAAVTEGSPAAAAGLRAGDLIVAVGGHDARFMTRREFLRRCRGPVGAAVELTLRSAEGAERTVELVRDEVR
jgi:hypothetical protein